jgi:hypothetical protein
VSVDLALRQINQCDLPAKTKVNATALLEQAHPENGYACLPWQTVCELFGVTSQAVARRHLGYMHEVNLVHYSSNGDGLVYVTFKAWTPAARVDARKQSKNSTESARGRAETVEKMYSPESADDDGARVDARKEYKNSTETVEKIDSTYTRTRARSVRSFVRNPSSTDTENERTNEQTPEPAEQARSQALLTDPDVGLDAALAGELAAAYGFDYLLRHVCEWRRQLAAGTVRSRGALLTRIKRRFAAAIIESDRASPLFRRHVPHEETAADDEEERRRKYDPAYWAED